MCFAPLLHSLPILGSKTKGGWKKPFHLLIRWSHQQSIVMRLSLLQRIEWPKKEQAGSKSKEVLIWSCEWQYWFAFSFLTGQDGDSVSRVMATITVTTFCFSCVSSVFHLLVCVCIWLFCCGVDVFSIAHLVLQEEERGYQRCYISVLWDKSKH